jgi:hypothetical protein
VAAQNLYLLKNSLDTLHRPALRRLHDGEKVQVRGMEDVMRLVVEADVAQRSGGVSAIARQIGIAGHGCDQETALASLRRSVAAWVMGLTAAGRLTDALATCGIRCDDQGSEGCVIDLRVA